MFILKKCKLILSLTLINLNQLLFQTRLELEGHISTDLQNDYLTLTKGSNCKKISAA